MFGSWLVCLSGIIGWFLVYWLICYSEWFLFYLLSWFGTIGLVVIVCWLCWFESLDLLFAVCCFLLMRWGLGLVLFYVVFELVGLFLTGLFASVLVDVLFCWLTLLVIAYCCVFVDFCFVCFVTLVLLRFCLSCFLVDTCCLNALVCLISDCLRVRIVCFECLVFVLGFYFGWLNEFCAWFGCWLGYFGFWLLFLFACFVGDFCFVLV